MSENALRGKRLLIVEEALKNRIGHWYEYNKGIVVEARKQGIQIDILGHRDIESDIAEELKVTPYFPKTSWDQVYFHPNLAVRYLGYLRHNFLVWRLIRRWLSRNDTYDVILVPTVVLYHWLAWRILARTQKKRFIKLVLTIRNNAGEYDPGTGTYRYNTSGKLVTRIVKSFEKLVKRGQVELASDSSRLAEQYLDISGVPITTYPHPRPTEHLPIPSRSPLNGRPIVFSALGPPRYEKGSDLLISAIDEILREHPNPNAKFVIQWTNAVHRPNGEEVEIPNLLVSHPSVEIFRESLSSEEYQDRIEQADFLLTPYRSAQYHARLSGIVIEGFQSGVPCICCENTWLADCMSQIGTGIAIKEGTSQELKKAILLCLDHRDEMSEQAFEHILEARATHSPSNYLTKLMDPADCH